jgi:hypothetical protein
LNGIKEGIVLRKMLFLLIVCLFAWSGLAVNVAASEFKDMDRKRLFYNEIIYLKNEGIISGFPDGTFRPRTDYYGLIKATYNGETKWELVSLSSF